MQFLDDKMDDGDSITGKVISVCMDYPFDNEGMDDNNEYWGGSNYKDSIDKKGFCKDAYFKLDI